MQTIMEHHLKKDQRGVSNIIVVVLSLIIIVVIVANVILWSYQMNQLDWEKMQESVSIENVIRGLLASYNPSGYTLGGSTQYVSGSLTDLQNDNSVYMTFRSYQSASSSQSLYAHVETTTIGPSTYRLLKTASADGTATSLAASGTTTGRKLWGKFVYSLSGVSSISASVWTLYYRTSWTRTLPNPSAPVWHCDVDTIIRKADDTIRATIATDVANSANGPSAENEWATLSSTYSWSTYIVVDQTDYLEIDFYGDVTTAGVKADILLRIDDPALAIADQTRVTNITFPSEYTIEVEFTGTSNMQSWTQLVWTIDSAWTTSNVSVTLQVFDYTLGAYPTSGNGYISYTSSATPNTDETRNQTITVNPTHFRGASGNWKIKIKGVKSTSLVFDSKIDWIEFKPSNDDGSNFTFKNKGVSTSHIVSLWIINSTYHQRYSVDIFLNSGQTLSYLRADISLPSGQYVVKIVTDRGNAAVYSED